MIIFSILVATLLGGVISVLLASLVALTFLARFADSMVAFAVGVLLTTALTSILPEAVEQGLPMEQAGWLLLAGIMVFFMLEKMALWRHAHVHGHGGVAMVAHPRVSMIVIGDGLHNFVDGVLIAAAFLVDPSLGWATAASVLAHEIPQEISDFMVLLDSGLAKGRALLLNALSGGAMVLGGLLGWLTLESTQAAIPVILVLAASSFIYIAVADLVPELHRKRSLKDAALQLGLMLLGILVSLETQHLH